MRLRRGSRTTNRAQNRQAVPEPGGLVPVPKVHRPDPTQRGGVHLGRLLEAARTRIGLSEDAAADRLRISTRELFDFESGMRTPSDVMIALMCEAYGVDQERLVSDAGTTVDDPEHPTTISIAWYEVELEGIDDRERLQRVATTYRRLRKIAEDRPVIVRDEELDQLSLIVDIDAPTLAADIQATFRLGEQTSAELAARMRYQRTGVKELPGSPAALGPAPTVD